MYTRDLKSNEGTIKFPKDMKGKYCLQPFTNVDIHSNNGVRCCSESWMPSWIGDFSQNTIKEIWNMDNIKKIRQSILDGSYEYCDWHQCPFYSNDEHYLYSKEELGNPELLKGERKYKVIKYKAWIKYILEGKNEIDILPANYNLAYDESCNLACPSCRDRKRIYDTGEEYEIRLKIHKKLIQEIAQEGLSKIGNFNITGSGEPFVSKIFQRFLYNFYGNEFPNIDINIQSNGLLFTKENWDKMYKIHNNINEVIISLDAANPDTYKKIRVNGNYYKLLENIGFLATLRDKNKIKRLMLAFVVQEKNYREMVEVIKIGKHYKIDLILFNLLNDWLSWNPGDYEKNAVWKSYHPKYYNFLEVLKDDLFDDEIVDLGNMFQYRKEAVKWKETYMT